MPNLNKLPFIVDRMESIVSQTYQDWECIVYDSHSDDGSWEIIQEYALNDERFVLSQGPREGIYPAFNYCVQRAKGDFIYFATSDDTMSPDCLSEMIDAFEQHPECDICQCGLQMIDREGSLMTGEGGRLCWEKVDNVRFHGDKMRWQHVRIAPHDGLVAMGLGTAWTSLTQVLIRRSIFDEVGLFPTNWKGVGDAAWQMKAGLVASVVYIPEKLATWRWYEGQGSGITQAESKRKGWKRLMTEDALQWIADKDNFLAKKIYRSGIMNHFLLDSALGKIREFGNISIFLKMLRLLIADPKAFLYYINYKIIGYVKIPASRSSLLHTQIEKVLRNS